MFNPLIVLTIFIYHLAFSALFANCCQCADISVGWRRDSLDWKTSNLESSYICADANSHIFFKDINLYTISGKAKWVDSTYYIRLSAEYGRTYKGEAKEHFCVDSPLLYFPVKFERNHPIKRNSEVYDFDGAVGHPLTFCCCRLAVIPLIGFSYHRQRLSVKEEDHCCYCSSYSYSRSCPSSSSSSKSCHSRRHHHHHRNHHGYHCSDRCGCCSSSSSSSFFVCHHNPFIGHPHDNPFSESSSDSSVNPLGLFTNHQTSNYRFTWYGFYLGTDLAYGLDPCWTLFSELEFHFLNRCHRKRKSWTGVEFVDDHHREGWGYGFNGVVGATYSLATCWYTTLAVDFRWWQANSKNDHLEWKMVGAKIGLGYTF